ncbi:hypothetical protein [Serratia sp. (in: enterobacteria)]|uniref:hypothetical protein n=1 Tax=Serratia sp. (in: enterobacteria) TaxID=616 RepID=UPI00398A150B
MRDYTPTNKLVDLPYKYTPMDSLSETYKETPESVLWISEVDKTITKGEEQLSVGYKPTFKEVIVNYGEYNRQKQLLKEGKITDYKGTAGVHPQWYDDFVMVQNAWNTKGKQGVVELGESGMLTGADFATVKSAVVALKTTSTPIRNHILTDPSMVTRIQSDRLDLKIDDYVGYDAINEELGVWNIPVSGKGGFTSQTVSQKKYGWHLQWSEDFTMQVYDIDVMQYHVNALKGQMETVMAKKVAAQFNALSATTLASWSAFTAGLSNRNAKIDVKNIAKVVDSSLRGSPQRIVSNRDVYDVFQSNTAVAPGGVGSQAGVNYSFGNALIRGVGGFDSIIWGVDDLITTDRFTVYDPLGIIFVDGPQRTAQYEDTRQGIRGTIFKRWFVSKIVDTSVFNTGNTIL